MKNDYYFWEKYLFDVRGAINELCKNKKNVYVDLHIHSNYSADGKQTISEIIKSTKDKGFDVIAITDHDTLDAYNELYEIVKDGLTEPIIIPGIEFTIDNLEYGNQCHILQLFVNPKDDVILKNVDNNYKAMFNRSKIQIRRLKDNLAIREIIKNKKIRISYQEYLEFLKDSNLVPEYDTLCEYLMEKFKSVNVSTFDVLELLEKYNKEDFYRDRFELKNKRYKKLREKYQEISENYYNVRFLLSMLAVREVDDDWWDKPSSGSLSVNSFGQIKVCELNEKYPTYFAHPTGSKLDVVEKIISNKKSIIGLEENIRNLDSRKEEFDKLLNKKKLLKIVGSDSHDCTGKFYDDMLFYRMSSKNFKMIL